MSLIKLETSEMSKQKVTLWRVVLLATTSILLTLLMTTILWDVLYGFFEPAEFEIGHVAQRDIRAPRQISIENVETTERQRGSAARNIPKIFRHEDLEEDGVSYQLKQVFESLRQLQSDRSEKLGDISLSKESKETFERQFRIDLVGTEWDALLDTSLWPQLEKILFEHVQPLLDRGVIANKRFLENSLKEGGAVLVRRSTGTEQTIFSTASVVELTDAIDHFEATFPRKGFSKRAGFDSLIKKLGGLLIKSNVQYDSAETELRMQRARDSISPDTDIIKRFQIVVKKGDVVSANQYNILKRISEAPDIRLVARKITGFLILTVLVIVTVYLFTVSIWPNFKPRLRDLTFIAFTLFSTFFLIRGLSFVGYALSGAYPIIDPEALALVAPLVAGGILLEVTMGASAVFLFTMTSALLAGVFLPSPQIIMLLMIMGNFVGAVSVKRCTRRSVFLVAGARVALINMIIVLCFVLLNPEVAAADNALKVLCVVIGGFMSAIIGFTLTPVAEYIGSYVTDIRLLELASLDRPLLREISMQAPGTWNHSMVMGQMVETAAEAIGANALLTRVGAYYHDVGKMKKPSYFTENQVAKKNPHDKLTPSMSALIIQAHVKDGVEIAKQFKLPQAIIDFIPQHHGTALIEYFYEKALKECEEDETVEESSYRYTGQKPQTREAGILMLADGIEASSRTLSDPTPAKIQGLVQKMTNKIFASGQLEESNLTLRDLHTIAKSFIRVLTGIHHRRIQYSEPAEKVRETTELKIPDSLKGEQGEKKDTKEKRGTKANAGEKKSDDDRRTREGSGKGQSQQESRGDKKSKGSGEDTLKRLGIGQS